jgi:hypothetical protein
MTPLRRYGLLSLGIGAVILGAGSLGLGNLHYANTQGEAVFAPYAIVVGALLILVVLRWDKTLQDNQHKK